MIRYFSVCSGIEAATVAWAPLGWTAVGFAEIEKFPSTVLAHRYGSNMPGEPLSRNAPPNFGDFTEIEPAMLGPVDVLVGGTPCQSFSLAGKRLSLADARGNLALAYVVLAHELARSNELRNAVWENVPGVQSTDDNAFGCFLGGLVGADSPLPLPRGIERWPDAGMVAGPRARAAWRIFDAQYFGLAQRRERMFVVADFGGGADPAAVLFERQGLHGNPAPRREYGPDARPDAGSGVAIPILDAGKGRSAERGSRDGIGIGGASDPMFTLREGSTHGVATIGFSFKDYGQDARRDVAPTMRSLAFDKSLANGGSHIAVAFDLRGREGGAKFEGPHDTANIRAASGGSSRSYVATEVAVRRLTPRECERLQGFEDDYTLVPWRGALAPDGPRYRALGNSMAVPVMRWIGARMHANMPTRTEAKHGDEYQDADRQAERG